MDFYVVAVILSFPDAGIPEDFSFMKEVGHRMSCLIIK